MKALSIQNLKKTYQGRTEALRGISFDVAEGDFFALLGPNGAGKTTAIGIITQLVNKTTGLVKVFDTDIDKNPNQAKSFIGLVPQEFNFNIFEKVSDIVINQAGFYGIERKAATKQAERYLKKLGLWEKRDEKSQNLSGGMKRKLMIVRALIHEPKLLILDEPTAGVDVETRREMWEFLTQLNEKGVTIILTTHYLEEAEQLCKNIAIIDNGVLIENTAMKSLLQTLKNEVFVLDLKNPINHINKIPGYNVYLKDRSTIIADVTKEQTLNGLFHELSKQNIDIVSLRNQTNRLEELFINLTRKS